MGAAHISLELAILVDFFVRTLMGGVMNNTRYGDSRMKHFRLEGGRQRGRVPT